MTLHDPASDVERLRIIAQLISRRLSELAASPSLTADEQRERHVLQELRRDWLLEGRQPPPT